MADMPEFESEMHRTAVAQLDRVAERLHLDLESSLNGERFGLCNAGPEMTFHFGQLIAHLCKTRNARAGSIVGSGTVSNKDWSRGYSCIAEKRAIEDRHDRLGGMNRQRTEARAFAPGQEDRLHGNHRCYHVNSGCYEPPELPHGDTHLPRAAARGRAADELRGPADSRRADRIRRRGHQPHHAAGAVAHARLRRRRGAGEVDRPVIGWVRIVELVERRLART